MSAALVIQRCRTLVINATIWLLNKNQRIYRDAPDITWQDRLRWFNKRILDRVFEWAWRGSVEEVESVYLGEIPPKYMTLWQKAILAQVPREEIDANCSHCSWRGTLEEAVNDDCPCCHEAVWIEPFEVGEAEA